MEPEIPAENWANKDLYMEDLLNGMPIEERMRNARKGRYKLTETYPEPHRNSNGQIIIENYELYSEDLKTYGAYQTHKWIEQGKYNLDTIELEKQRMQRKKDLERFRG